MPAAWKCEPTRRPNATQAQFAFKACFAVEVLIGAEEAVVLAAPSENQTPSEPHSGQTKSHFLKIFIFFLLLTFWQPLEHYSVMWVRGKGPCRKKGHYDALSQVLIVLTGASISSGTMLSLLVVAYNGLFY